MQPAVSFLLEAESPVFGRSTCAGGSRGMAEGKITQPVSCKKRENQKKQDSSSPFAQAGLMKKKFLAHDRLRRILLLKLMRED